MVNVWVPNLNASLNAEYLPVSGERKTCWSILEKLFTASRPTSERLLACSERTNFKKFDRNIIEFIFNLLKSSVSRRFQNLYMLQHSTRRYRRTLSAVPLVRSKSKSRTARATARLVRSFIRCTRAIRCRRRHRERGGAVGPVTEKRSLGGRGGWRRDGIQKKKEKLEKLRKK